MIGVSTGGFLRILQPTSLRRGKPDLWELDAVSIEILLIQPED